MTGVEGVGAQSVDRWHLMNFGYDPLKASN